MEGLTVYYQVPECHVTFGRGSLHDVWWDLHFDHWTSWGAISNVPWQIPAREALMKVAGSQRPQNKTLKREASPGIPYELWDKHTIGLRRWNIATQERKVGDMKVKIVTLVITGSAQLTVHPDRQELIQVGCRGVALPSCLLSQVSAGYVWPR